MQPSPSIGAGMARGAIAILLLFLAVDAAPAQRRRLPNYNYIEKGLWLGGRVDEPPEGVTAVLNVCELKDVFRTEHYLWKPIHDGKNAATLEFLQETVAFIDRNRKAGRSVYVHCNEGVSRGPLVMAAYLMYAKGWTRRQALDYLREARPVVRPNPSFMDLLYFWEEKLKQDVQ
jgi:protein-tyrosine phosphatase